jgi:acyl-CoA reductase-like NAD-dependent aldehyde dehydrogenase
MSATSENKELKQSKSAISKACKQFEKDMMSAKNALERVHVLNQMEDILNHEIDSWVDTLDNENHGDISEVNNVINHAAEHIENMSSIIRTINSARAEMLSEAKKVAIANKNSHVNHEPVRYVDYETE